MRWHGEAEHSCGLSVDDELELTRLLDWQFRRFRALKDATGIDTELTPRIRDVLSVAHQPADFCDFTRGGCHGNRVARRHGGQLNPPAVEKSVGAHEQGIGPLAHKRRNAASISLLVLALRIWIFSPMARAAASTSFSVRS